MRRWGFRIVAAVGLPIFALLLLEAALRIGGYGENRAYMVRDRIAGVEVWRDNPAFFGLFFPPQLRPAQLPFVVPRQKPASELRVLLLGGSAAMGIPDAAFGMGPILEELLEARHPGVDVDVLNLANTAINSHVVREIAEASMKLEPDLVVVYLGNNEVVGPFGAGTVFTPVAPPRSVIAASIALQRTRVGQLLRGLFDSAVSKKQPTSWRGMEMFLEQQVAAEDPGLKRVHENFRANLRAICRAAIDHGVPVVLSNVGVNLRHCAPFGSQESPSCAQQLELEEQARRRGDLQGAFDAAGAAVEADPGSADAHYRLGRVALALADTATGVAELRRARDLDTLRFRADSKTESIIAEVAASQAGVRFVDVADTLDAESPFGVSGREFFLEHVHLDWSGNHRVARALLPAVESALEEQRPEAFRDREVGSAPSALKTAQYLAYTPWTRVRLLRQILSMQQRPPFTGQSDHLEQVARLQSEVSAMTERMARIDPQNLWRVYEQSIARHPDRWIRRYQAALFAQDELGDWARAEELWRQITIELPHFPAAWNQLAECVARQGRSREARQLLERSLGLLPYQPEMLWNLARLLREEGDEEQATRRLHQLLELEPEHTAAREMLRELQRP